MHDHILMQFMSYSVGEGFLEANSSHDFIEDVVVDALLHGWQQLDVHWLVEILEQHLLRHDLIILADVLLPDEQLLNAQQLLQLVSPLQLPQSREIVCL